MNWDIIWTSIVSVVFLVSLFYPFVFTFGWYSIPVVISVYYLSEYTNKLINKHKGKSE